MSAREVDVVLASARAGKPTGLLPHLAAWEKLEEQNVADVRQAVANLAAMEPPSDVARRDVAVAQAALARMSTLERSGSAGKLLETALRGAQQCGFLAPQAALLVSNRSGRWGHISTEPLSNSTFFGPYLDLATKAFSVVMDQTVLQRDTAQLDPLHHVLLRRPDHMPAATAALPPKPKPVSRQLRDDTNALGGHFVNFLKPQGG